MYNECIISPNIQNDIIETYGEIIHNHLVKSINNAQYFSVQADEASDNARTESFLSDKGSDNIFITWRFFEVCASRQHRGQL